MIGITALGVSFLHLKFHAVAHGFSRSEKRLSAPPNKLGGLGAWRTIALRFISSGICSDFNFI